MSSSLESSNLGISFSYVIYVEPLINRQPTHAMVATRSTYNFI